MNTDWHAEYQTALDAWNDEIDRRKAATDELEEAIGFGGHKEDCPAHPDFGGGAYSRKCDCGWEAFLDKHRSKGGAKSST